MKYLIAIVFMVIATIATANEKITVRFDSITVTALSKIVLGDVLAVPYVIDDGLGLRNVNMIAENIPKSAIADVFVKTLNRQGVDVRVDSGIYSVTLLQESEVIVHRLQHRSADYVRSIVRESYGAQTADVHKPASPVVNQQPAPSINGLQGQQMGTLQQSANQATASAVRREAEAPDTLVFVVPKRLAMVVRHLLDFVDSPTEQVFVKAVAYDVETISGKGSALDVAIDVLNGRLGLTLKGGRIQGSTGSLTLQIGGLSAIVDVLDQDGRFSAMSRPSVRVRSGSKARFAVGQEVPTLAGVTTSLGGATQNVVYRQAGVVFEVEPTVRPGGVNLIVKQSVSAVSTTESSTLNSPTINKRELDTELTVQSGDVVILAGLDAEESSEKSKGLFDFTLGKTQQKTKKQSLLVLELTKI